MHEFNGFSFDDASTRSKMKYIVIYPGDLDSNNAYGFENKIELDRYLGDSDCKEVFAVFKVEDVTA